MTAPCKDCERREVGCHAKCKEYLDYHEYNERCFINDTLCAYVRDVGHARKTNKKQTELSS